MMCASAGRGVPRDCNTVRFRAPEHPLLLVDGEVAERAEVVDPPLGDHMGTARSGIAVRNERYGDGFGHRRFSVPSMKPVGSRLSW